MRVLFVTLILAAVALAGCSDDPPSGEFSSTGTALVVEGTVHTAEFQSFEDPTPQQLQDAGFTCAGDNAPSELTPLDQYRCTQASTNFELTVHSVPATGGTWGMAFTCGECANPADTKSPLTDNGDGSYSWAAMVEGENKEEMWDQVTLFLDDTPIATSPLNAQSTLSIVPNLSGITYAATYNARDLTVTVSGVSEEAPVGLTGWLVTVDADGIKTHDEQFPITGNGETMFTATKTIDTFQEFHIHLAGTQINLATGTIA